MPSTSSSTSAVDLPQGVFQVDASGQACYHLPLAVPPGTAGMAPALALSYSHRGPNGVVGVGWDLQGLSAITRTPATHAQDGYNAPVSYTSGDRLSLDGQRLVAISGDYGAANAVYYTEIQSWQQIKPQGAGFVVRTKNGETWSYGTTPDSRFMTADGQAIRVWALARREDRFGNAVAYTYTETPTLSSSSTAGQADGNSYLDRIDYTLRPGVAAQRSVRFQYELRNDVIRRSVAGQAIVTSFRLSTIQTTLVDGSVTVKQYRLGYGTSAATGASCLLNVTESGFYGSTSVDLTPTRLGWQDVQTPDLSVSEPKSMHARPDQVSVHMMDTRGNGCVDTVQLWRDGDHQLHATIYRAEADGFHKAGDSRLGFFGHDLEVLTADVNGDDRQDLLVAYRRGDGTLGLAVCFANGSGFDAALYNETGDPWHDERTHLQYFAMDVDGDGRTDLVEAYAAADGTLAFRTYRSLGDTAGSFAPAVQASFPEPARPGNVLGFWGMDVNNDGMADLVRVCQEPDGEALATSFLSQAQPGGGVAFSHGKRSSLGTWTDKSLQSLLAVDVNGDGRTDLLQIWQETVGDDVTLHFTAFASDGTGRFVSGTDTAFASRGLSAGTFMPMAFHGSGSPSIVRRWPAPDGRVKFHLYQGSWDGTYRDGGSFSAGAAGSLYDSAAFFVADVNGDGKSDLVRIDVDALGLPAVLSAYTNSPNRPDLLHWVVNPLGGRVTVGYGTLADPAVYSAGGDVGAVDDVVRLAGGAMCVATSYAIDHDDNVTNLSLTGRHEMAYSGAVSQLNGRGWQGFTSVSNTNVTTAQRTTYQFQVSFPTAGMLSGSKTEALGASGTQPVLMRENSQTWYGGVSGIPGVYAVRLDKGVETQYHDGGFDHAVAKTFVRDGYGNVIQETYLGYVDANATESPLDPTKVVYRYASYLNDESDWAIGLLENTKTSTTWTAADALDGTFFNTFGADDLKLEQRAYDASTRKLVLERSWDSSNHVFLETSHAYDEVGNRRQTVKPGHVTTDRTFDATYKTFLDTSTLSGGTAPHQVTTYSYDPRFGMQVAKQAPNGCIHLTQLDPFGRVAARQTNASPGHLTDANGLTPLATGSGASGFRSAAVSNLELCTYDVSGAPRVHEQRRQTFSSNNASAYVSSWRYVDGLGQDRQSVLDSGPGGGDITVTTDYDANGRVSSRSVPYYGKPAEPGHLDTSYDALGRPIRHVQASGQAGSQDLVTTWTYGARGTVTKTAGVGSASPVTQTFTEAVYDGVVRIVSTNASTHSEGQTTFEYDVLGRPFRTIDAKTDAAPAGVKTEVVLDSLDRRTSLESLDFNPVPLRSGCPAMTYAYDPSSGLLTSTVDAEGHRTTYQYDGLGRLRTHTMWDGLTVTYTYDTPNAWDSSARALSLGHLTAVTMTQNGATRYTREYAYDVYGSVVEEHLAIDGASYTTSSSYDPQRRLIEQHLPDGEVLSRTYSYGKLIAQSLGAAQVAYPTEQYTPFGLPSQMDAAGTMTSYWSYNPLGVLQEEMLVGGDVIRVHQKFEYDVLGQVTTIRHLGEIGQDEAFTYDGRRLATATIAGASLGYTYDLAGNMVQKEGVTFTYQGHFPGTGIDQTGTVFTASQDLCGRTNSRTLNGVTNTYSYDGFGLLSEVKDERNATLRYILNDHQGQCLKRTENDGSQVLYVGPCYVVKTAANGAVPSVTKYLRDARGVVATIEGSTVRYLRRDRLGSTTHVFDPSGNQVAKLTYRPYGECTVEASNGGEAPEQLRYEQRPWDEGLKLYDFKSRAYDPFTGRFLTPDTRLGSPRSMLPDTFNRFAMELNNPVNHVDPTGHSVSAGLAIGISVGLLAIGAAILAVGLAVATAGAGLAIVGGAVGAAAAGVAAGVTATATTGELLGLAGAVAAPIMVGAAVLSSPFIVGGAAGLGYASTHLDDFSWGDFAAVVGVSAAIGTITAGLGEVISALPIEASTLVGSVIIGAVESAATAVVSSAGDTAATLAINAATGVPLDTGLASAAVLGFAFGAVAGSADRLLEAGVGAIGSRVTNMVGNALERRALGSLNRTLTNQVIAAEGVQLDNNAVLALVNATNRAVASQRGILALGLKGVKVVHRLPAAIIPVPQLYSEARVIFGASEEPEEEEELPETETETGTETEPVGAERA